MNLVDFILNLAGLLLWMKWRSLPFDPFNRRTPATLVGTLRRAAPSHFRRWHLLAGIGLLLVLRAMLYWQIGPAVHWNGRLDLSFIAITLRSDLPGRMLLYSVFSFGLALGVLYLWLLLLSLLARSSTDAGPVHRLVRVQLGRIDGWPRRVKIVLPLAAGALAWWLVSWLLAWMNLVPRPASAAHRLGESALIGLGTYVAWKYVAAVLFVLRLLNTYIYFGKHPFWNYADTAAQTLLAPLRKIPLRAGRVDFAPVAGIILVFLAAELAQRGLGWLYSRLPP